MDVWVLKLDMENKMDDFIYLSYQMVHWISIYVFI